MKRTATAIALMVLAGCSTDADKPLVPLDADVARLEILLEKHRCVGTLNEWERNYRLGYQEKTFWPGAFEPKFDIIEFRFRHTGPVSIVAARNIVRVGADHDWPDSPAVRTLTGRYNARSGRLTVDRCEPSNSTPRHEQPPASAAQSPPRP